MKRVIVIVIAIAAIAGCVRTVVLDPQPDAAGAPDSAFPDGVPDDAIPGDAPPADGSSPDVPHD